MIFDLLTGTSEPKSTDSEGKVSICIRDEDLGEFKEPPATQKELESDLAKTQKSAYSPGTLRNLICQWKSFLRFCKKYGINKWPVSEHILSLYAQFLGYTFHSPKAIRNYLSGVRTLHILTKSKPPNLKDPEIRLTMRGLERLLQHESKQAPAMTPEILVDMLGFLDLDNHEDLVFWGICVIGTFAMLRKSNLVPDSVKSFDPLKQLTPKHVVLKEGLALLKITWAKNIQFRQKVLEIPLFEVEGSALCPVKILRKLKKIQQGNQNWPLFGLGRHVTYTYTQFHKKLRSVLCKAGYRGKVFSSHSLRRGGVAWAHRSGVPENLIQVHGGWKSDAYKRYLSFPLEIRAAVSLRMRDNIKKSGL